MKKILASASALLFFSAQNSPSFAADGIRTTALVRSSDFPSLPGLIGYDDVLSGLLVSLLIIGIYAFYWFKQKA